MDPDQIVYQKPAHLDLQCFQKRIKNSVDPAWIVSSKASGSGSAMFSKIDNPGPAGQWLKLVQGSHRLENYWNIQDCLEKSLKIKFALKSS